MVLFSGQGTGEDRRELEVGASVNIELEPGITPILVFGRGGGEVLNASKASPQGK